MATVTQTQQTPRNRRTRTHKRPGFLLFNRPPRLWEAIDKTVIAIPQPPVPASNSRSSLITSLGVPALGFTVMLAIALLQTSMFPGRQSEIFVWLGLAMSSVYLIGSVWSLADEFFSNRKLFKKQVAEYKELLVNIERTLAQLNEQEQQIRMDLDPPVEELCRRVADPSSPSTRIWERRPSEKDFLRIRFGKGPSESSTEVSFTPPAKPSDLTKDAEVLIARYANLASAPLTVDLKEIGSLGVAGQADPTNNLVISMLCQLIAHHSPTEVRLMALFPEAHLDSWSWLRWSPHTEALGSGDVGDHALACTPERAHEVLHKLQEETSSRERRLAAQGRASDATPVPGPHVVVLLDSDSLMEDGLMTEFLLERGPALKVHTIYIAPTLSTLPSSCGAVIQVGHTPDDPVSYRSVSTRQRAFGNIDYTTPATAEVLARALSPIQLEVTDRTNGIPDQVRLLDLLNISDPSTADVGALWKKHDAREHLRIPIGQGTGETTLYLSLQSGSAEGGPHGIIGGMTGSGKSELLRSIVAAFAITHHPHRLNFVLIDYKGGGAFQGLEELPHVVGFVTNLDEHLAERALVALQSELKERQRRLADVGVDSVQAYQELSDHSPGRKLTPLPNLLLIIDEFAQLKEEVPDFIQGLIGIARVGRSLGVHLLLATQKPSGVVTDEIRANTSYKVCLRVAEPQDSTEVIGSPDAALLPRTVPGRAFIQVGTEQTLAFQAARITTRYAQLTTRVNTAIEDFDPTSLQLEPQGSSAPTAMSLKGKEETELQVIVRRIAQEASTQGIALLRPPWPPPLPEGIALRDVMAAGCVPTGSPYKWPSQPPDGWVATSVGLLDDPARQRQGPFLLKLLEVGHAVVYGMARTGKSTFLRSAAASLALTHSPEDLHIYCLEFGRGALVPLAGLPHCGDVLTPTDIEKVRRFFSDLRADMADRARAIQKAGVFTLTEYRANAQRESGFPYIVVLLDNFTTFRETFFGDNAVLDLDLADKLLGDLTSLFREGQAVGIHFLITVDSWQPISRYPAIVNALGMRIALKQADTSDYSYVGVRGRDDLTLPPGRGFVSGATPLECQIAMPILSRQMQGVADPAARRSDYVTWLRSKLLGQAAGPKPKFDELQVPVQWMSGEEQADALEELCRLLSDSWQGQTAPPVRQLPDTVTLDTVLSMAIQPTHPGANLYTPLGIDDSTLQPFMLELKSESPVYLVAGPAHSGKSTLLLAAILGLIRRYTPAEVSIAVAAFRRSPLWRLNGLPHFGAKIARNREGLNELIDWLEGELDRRQSLGASTEGEPSILTVIDDLEEILMDDLAPLSRLVEVAKRGRTTGMTLLVAGLNQELTRAYDTLSDYLKRDQTGFLLSPNLRDDGEILNIRLPMMTHRTFPPGRGFYARRRAWTILHVATPQQEGMDLEGSISHWLDGKV